MNRHPFLEVMVGIFILSGILAFAVLSLKVSGLQQFTKENYYRVSADFDNIGDLKPRAPVTIAGVHIGEVDSIYLSPETFKARVVLQIDNKQKQIPSDSSASIFTEGLLGSNYISIAPGFGEPDTSGAKYLHDGSMIQETNPALILENLIGQLLFQINGNKSKSENKEVSKENLNEKQNTVELKNETEEQKKQGEKNES